MGVKCRSPRLLGNQLGKWGCPSDRQSIGLIPNCSSVNTPDGISGGPNCPIILHSMFLHAAGEGQKEVERFICQGCWHNLPRPDPEANLPTIQLVGYWTSWKEIWDLYHEVYLLRRLPGHCHAGPSWGQRYIGHLVLTEKLFAEVGRHCHTGGPMQCCHCCPWPVCHPESWSRSCDRRNPHDEGLWEAHQQALEVTCRLELYIERLSQEAGSVQHWHPCSPSGSHLQSRSLDRCKRSLSQHRSERHVTLCNPEVELILGKRSYGEAQGHSTWTQMERGEEGPLLIQRPEMLHPWEMPATYPGIENRMGYLPEPSIKNYEVWLNWQAHQLDTPHW